MAAVGNRASNFGEADIATSIAHCYHGEEGVRCKARHDVCRASSNGEPWNVQGAGVGGLHTFTIGKPGNDRSGRGGFVCGGCVAGEEVAGGSRVEVCPFLDRGHVSGDGLEQGGGRVSIVVGGGQARSRIKINVVV